MVYKNYKIELNENSRTKNDKYIFYSLTDCDECIGFGESENDCCFLIDENEKK